MIRKNYSALNEGDRSFLAFSLLYFFKQGGATNA